MSQAYKRMRVKKYPAQDAADDPEGASWVGCGVPCNERARMRVCACGCVQAGVRVGYCWCKFAAADTHTCMTIVLALCRGWAWCVGGWVVA